MREKGFHLLVVACKNENDLSRQILNLGQQEVKNSSASIARSRCELIRFIDEKRTTPFIQEVFQYLLTTLNAPTGELGACRLDHQVPWQGAYRCEKSGVQSRNGCLAYE